MKSLNKALLGFAVAVVLTGCSTIEYTQNNTGSVGMEVYKSMHHNFAFSLYEYSQPVNLADCGNDWSSLVVEKDVVTALAGSIDDAIVFVDVWDPWAVTLNCSQ
ncbi:hypothetical protein [Saccharospirillum impatiens]|uniref:hypothetical protein n=1 Tax=Saccharospirillum impatiens TaxID=169438 RepID=UPI00041CC7A9|nr:hypothetical protein [Saccharospirillum impatiens]